MDERPPDPTLLSERERERLPVFPLPGAVLLPGAPMALHVFEPRYRAMMQHCLGEGPMAMAIATLAPHVPLDAAGRPAFHPIAGAGRIVLHRRNDDGTFDLLLVGTERVRLHELAQDRPFRWARAERLVDTGVVRPADLAATLALAAQVPGTSSGAELPSAELPGAASRVADALGERLTATDPAERRRLLEMLDVDARLERVRDLLATALLARAGTRVGRA